MIYTGKVAAYAVILDEESHFLGEVGKGLSLDALAEALLKISPCVDEDIGLLPPVLEDKTQQLLSPNLPKRFYFNVSHEIRLLLQLLSFMPIRLVLSTHAG